MKRIATVVLVLGGLLLLGLGAVGKDPRARSEVNIPDVLGYQTLKCDFHIHTVFSDGSVWPHIRSEEAWREGLDVIAITDHIEYQPHGKDLPTAHNRSFEIAEPHGKALDVTVLRGSEITRRMPPGHLNAIILEDAEPLDTEHWRDSIKAAHSQGAFIFWNHPGWKGQQPDGVAKWYPEHTELVDQGLLHGIEVVNSREYYPEAHQWCIEKNLTMISNSDVHNPLNLDYELSQGDHRPMTLVFSREKSPAAIKEALFARRTAVYSGDNLIGEERYLRAIFEESTRVKNPQLKIIRDGAVFLQISNSSDLDYELTGGQQYAEIAVPDRLLLQAGKTVLLTVKSKLENQSGTKRFALPYTVENLKIAPNAGMPIAINIEVSFSRE